MALSEDQKEWLQWASGQDIAAARAANKARDERKAEFMNDVLGARLDGVRSKIDEAMSFDISFDKSPGKVKALFMKIAGKDPEGKGTMPWRADVTTSGLRADNEVDIRADIDHDVDEVPKETIDKVRQAFDQIKELEAAMKLQFDNSGEPLFTDEDIRKELWTPLVRSGLIPDNVVLDKYSEQAIAFSGARELYQAKLDDFTASTSKREQGIRRALAIAKDTAAVVGTVTSGAVTCANAVPIANADSKLTQMKLDGAPADQIQAQKDKIAALKQPSTYTTAASALLGGVLSIAEAGVDHHYDKESRTLDKWIKTAQTGVGIAQGMAAAGLSAGLTAAGTNDGLATCIQSGVSAGFTAVRLGPSLAIAIREPDKTKQLAMITGMVGDLATGIAASINAVGGKIASSGTDADKKTQAHLEIVAAQIENAIKRIGSAPLIYDAYRKGDKTRLGVLLGGQAVASVSAALGEALYGAMRKDISEQDLLKKDTFEAQFFEVEDDPATRDDAAAKLLAAMTASTEEFDAKVFESIKPDQFRKISPEEAKALEAETVESVAKAQEQEAQKLIQKGLSLSAMEDVLKDADRELMELDEIYSDAFPDADLAYAPEQEIIEAHKAIDRAIAKGNELRLKVEIVNGVTAGAAGLLASIVPGTGAVVAAQKLVADIYKLSKAVKSHNAWVESMEVAIAAQSGTTAAVGNVLANAKIHMDHAIVTVVLSSIKASAEVARMADPSGVATIVSTSTSMADAVVEYGYKMHAQSTIDTGWKAYKRAREDPANRKAGREALRLNTTLAKCCIAYGASIMNDLASQEAIRATGLTVTAFQNDKDICVKLVAYLQAELTDAPEVMKVDYRDDGKWHPGSPELNLASWTAFKAAARRSAKPALAPESISTPAVDRLIVEIGKPVEWENAEAQKAALKQREDDDGKGGTHYVHGATRSRMRKEAESVINLSARLDAALSAYAPKTATTEASPHAGMLSAAQAFATMARTRGQAAKRTLKELDLA